MSVASNTNQLLVVTMALEAANRVVELNALLAKTAAEGRGPTDEEVALLRASALAAVNRLEQAG